MNESWSRYVIDTDTDMPVWHRVNEHTAYVYSIETWCGLRLQYPNDHVTFKHHTFTDFGDHPSCMECDKIGEDDRE